MCLCPLSSHIRVMISDTLSFYYTYVSAENASIYITHYFKNILLNMALSVPRRMRARMLAKSFTTNYINLIKIYI